MQEQYSVISVENLADKSVKVALQLVKAKPYMFPIAFETIACVIGVHENKDIYNIMRLFEMLDTPEFIKALSELDYSHYAYNALCMLEAFTKDHGDTWKLNCDASVYELCTIIRVVLRTKSIGIYTNEQLDKIDLMNILEHMQEDAEF